MVEELKKDEIEECYINLVEEILCNYKFIEIYIKNLEEIIRDIDRGIFIQGIKTDIAKISPTCKIQNIVMNQAIDIVEAKKELEISLYAEKRFKKNLDIALNNLPKHLSSTIELKYIKNMSWKEIEYKKYLPERTARRYKDDGIKGIAYSLFGSRIYKNKVKTLIDMVES